MRAFNCPRPILGMLPAIMALSGCGVAGAAADIVTAPVKVVSKGVDLATTSQSEADEKRGRDARKREERLGKLMRERDKLQQDCYDDNDRGACEDLRAVNAEIGDLSRY